ncbi:hypothetical protein QAD02_019489 [Eretmocerus hayati]|uniref:Uncharacterized protein n=1 Tax=Eretmocerus hayati TaxID=131215 RepID=A0ACC2PMW6_9HYME|nr:hypothetical protein QAD02_019489 [Eretmocerus hayati]
MRKVLECRSHWTAEAIGMRTQVPGPHRHWNADVNKEGWPCHRETGMRKVLECRSHWTAEAIGMRTQVPGPHRHWNADVNKEGWPCHRETGMRKTLECGCEQGGVALPP